MNDYALPKFADTSRGASSRQRGNFIIRMPGIGTIDMSAVAADALGHIYFATNPGAHI